MRVAIATFVFTVFAALSLPSLAVPPDWGAVADESEIIITVQEEDGSAREVTIWLLVLDEQGYIRTRNTSWHDDLARSPDVLLRIARSDYPVRAIAVDDEALVERIHEGFTEKYGLAPQIMLGVMRPFMGAYNVYRADPR